jgi:N-methylhydantoinase A
MSSVRAFLNIDENFTEIYTVNDINRKVRAKEISSTSSPLRGLVAELRRRKVVLGDVALLTDSATVAGDTSIARRLPRAAMICAAGSPDIIEMTRADKEGRRGVDVTRS